MTVVIYPGEVSLLGSELSTQQHLLRSAIILGRTATAGRACKLERKHNSIFGRLNTRWDDYQLFAIDPRAPWDNYVEGLVMPMSA